MKMEKTAEGCGNPRGKRNFCPNCGMKLPEQAKFCISCGQNIAEMDAEERQMKEEAVEEPQTAEKPASAPPPVQEESTRSTGNSPGKQQATPVNPIEFQFQQYGAQAAYLSKIRSAYFAYKLNDFLRSVFAVFALIYLYRSQWMIAGIIAALVYAFNFVFEKWQKKLLGFDDSLVTQNENVEDGSDQLVKDFGTLRTELYQTHFRCRSKEITVVVIWVIIFFLLYFFFAKSMELEFWQSVKMALLVSEFFDVIWNFCWVFKWVAGIIIGIFLVLLITHPVITLSAIAALFTGGA